MPVLMPDETEPVTDSGNNEISTEIQTNPVTEEEVSEAESEEGVSVSEPEDEEIYTHGDYELPEVSLDD